MDKLRNKIAGYSRLLDSLSRENYLYLRHRIDGFAPNLAGANFTNAHLRGANLQGANLSNANFSNANLDGVNLDNANLTNANFTNAQVDFAGYVYLADRGYGGYVSDDFQRTLASDGAADDNFGNSVATSGDYAVVGADIDGDNGFFSGSAYIFTRSGVNWSEQAKLLPNDGTNGDQFGESVAISGDYAIVGAYQNDDNGGASGSAYIFTRSGANWSEQAKLLPNDGTNNDWFGESVAISGDYAIVGANQNDDKGTNSGSAYVFIRSNTSWSEQAKLLPNDGATGDNFGISVAISGDYAIVGAYGNADNGENSGSAYIFTRSGTNWSEQAKLLPNDGAAGDRFGYSVAISGDYAIVGAYLNDDNGSNSGSAYIFARSGVNWSEQAKLLPNDGAAGDRFGFSVSISGDYAVVGASQNTDHGANSGSAYIFTRSGANWSEQAKLLPNDGATGDKFGNSVSISDQRAIVGARGDNSSYIIKYRE